MKPLSFQKETTKTIFRGVLFLFLIFSGCSTHSDETRNWFPFQPKHNSEQSLFSMDNWLDAPAGNHGFLTFENENLVFEDGTHIKFWGTNICSQRPYVNAEIADSFVDFLAHYGVNAVRFHKFSWHGYADNISTDLDPNKFDRLDYFQSQLRNKGMYYGWSHIYGHRVQPGDSSRLIAYTEIKNLNYPWSHLNGSTSGLVNFAPDLQDLSIALTIHMLNHINPYTGLRYADDPALAFIEFQNEDNLFWSAVEKALDQAPTYRALLCEDFSAWLLKKYKTAENFRKAWGVENIPEGESLQKKNVYPQPNHGLFSWEYETAWQEKRPMAQHILDKMRFLYEQQLAFYKKFEKAVRETGYRGVLIGSCWQAGSGLAHFYNLHTDYKVGMIDRHNYFGGGAGSHRLDTGKVNNRAMVELPGSGLLGTGSQQVFDRPFALSEWMSNIPNEWTAESAPIVAIYGMGLQGWDASFSFATDIPRFSRFLESEWHGVYNATSPLHMGLYPTLARMVYRNDIRESPVIATKNVHIPSFSEGILGFYEQVKQGHDVKAFEGTFPALTMAVGRFPVVFTELYSRTSAPVMDAYLDTINKIITSATGELKWHYGTDKFFTVNTAFSKGFVGFAKDEVIEIGNLKLHTTNNFAVILLTSLSKKESLEESDSILITTIARARNTGMKYVYEDNEVKIADTGNKPLLMEPVNATIILSDYGTFEVWVLDHDGVITSEKVPVADESFTIDGKKYRTMYYLIRKKT